MLKNSLNDTQEENVQLRRQVDYEAAEVDKYAAHVKTLERAKDKVIQETEESRVQIAIMKEKIMTALMGTNINNIVLNCVDKLKLVARFVDE